MDEDVLMTIIAEALGEGPEGMRRVGETILNRAAIRGLTPEQVVRQPEQYTGFGSPGPAAIRAQQDPIARSAAEAAWQLARQPGDPTGGADHYHADYVSPYWASEMPSTGAYGAHQFYKSREVPADALSALLTPQTRDVPLPRSRPQSPSDQMADLFAGSFGGQQDPTVAAGLDSFLQRRTPSQPDFWTSNGINSVVQQGLANQDPTLSAALSQMLTKRAPAPMPTNVAQSYAGQERSAPISANSLFSMNGDPGGGSGRTIATIPTVARQPVALAQGGQQSYTGQDRNPSGLSNATVKSVADMFGMNGDPGGGTGKTIATVPTVASNIGKSPTTRVVQSVPVPKSVASAPAAPKMTAAQQRADNGQNRQVAKATAPKIDAVEAMPAFGDLAMMFGNSVPQASASINNAKDNSRLKDTSVIGRATDDVLIEHGMLPAKPATQAQAKPPTATPAKPKPAQTNLAVTQPQKKANVTMPTSAALRPAGATATVSRSGLPPEKWSSLK